MPFISTTRPPVPSTSGPLRFRNPQNGYVETSDQIGIHTLLFGFVYFAIKGVWSHAVASIFFAGLTFGISWLIYPFYAREILRTHYLRRGWIEL